MISVIIPLGKTHTSHSSFADRIRSLEFAIKTFYSKHDNIEIIVVVQNSDWSNKNVTFIHVNNEIFNKAWLINIGARKAKGTVLCVAESDMWADTPFLNEVEKYLLSENLLWCFGWNRIYYTTSSEKERLLSGIIPSISTVEKKMSRPSRGLKEGGFVFFRKKFYFSIGGHNERFQWLGGIDNEIALRAQKASGQYNSFPQIVFHLHHLPTNKNLGIFREMNKKLLRETTRNPMAISKALSLSSWGNPECPILY